MRSMDDDFKNINIIFVRNILSEWIQEVTVLRLSYGNFQKFKNLDLNLSSYVLNQLIPFLEKALTRSHLIYHFLDLNIGAHYSQRFTPLAVFLVNKSWCFQATIFQ